MKRLPMAYRPETTTTGWPVIDLPTFIGYVLAAIGLCVLGFVCVVAAVVVAP